MSPKRENILIVEPDEARRQQLEAALRPAGYDVTSAPSQEEGFRLVQTGVVDVFLLSADLADILCCNSLAEIKGLGSTSNTRVILFARGGAAERARGLDLGANDVLTPEWDSAELLARVRAQLREKHALEELQEKSRLAEEGQEIAHTAFQAIAVTEKMTRDAFSLDRALKIGVGALLGVAVLISIIFLLYSRRAEKETRRAYSVIAQLEHGVHTEEALVAEANQARSQLQQSDLTAEKQMLQQQTDDLRQKLSAADASEVDGLRKQLEETSGRLKRVENQAHAAEGVIRANAPSVCLIHVSVSFLDQSSRRPLRYVAINPDGQPLKDSEGNVAYSLDGRAPEVREDFFGTGFIVGQNQILTNHHVAQPWWKNDELSAATQQGLQPTIAEMTAYFPEATAGIPMNISQISDEADLAVLRGDLSILKRPVLKMDGRKEAAVSGQPLISLGYATGLSAILARAGEDTVKDIVKISGGDPKKIVEELQKRQLIRPLVTQGHIGDVLADKIVYDAQTTSGGSGGPLINRDGEVIGVTFAVVRGFGGSNFGVPIRFAQPLLQP
ncbi:MAG: trypsin-like peptidase domain-containing protein [Candidatus Acidiferrum sp.]